MELMTVKEAAAYTTLSAVTLNRLRSVGGGPVFYKLGRVIRYDKADLDAWMAGQTRTSTKEEVAR